MRSKCAMFNCAVRTESWWELYEHRDLVGSWCCKRSER